MTLCDNTVLLFCMSWKVAIFEIRLWCQNSIYKDAGFYLHANVRLAHCNIIQFAYLNEVLSHVSFQLVQNVVHPP